MYTIQAKHLFPLKINSLGAGTYTIFDGANIMQIHINIFDDREATVSVKKIYDVAHTPNGETATALTPDNVSVLKKYIKEELLKRPDDEDFIWNEEFFTVIKTVKIPGIGAFNIEKKYPVFDVELSDDTTEFPAWILPYLGYISDKIPTLYLVGFDKIEE